MNKECGLRDWTFKSHEVDVLKSSAGKPFPMLESVLAGQLYERLHRARIIILSEAEVFVPLNPTRSRLDYRWLARLSRIVRYKAYYERVEVCRPGLFEAIDDWLNAEGCESERDPRVLPLHSFCPSEDLTKLREPEGRAAFARKFGPPLHRRCEQRFHWVPDPSRHAGREPQNVAGRILPAGFHWDVTISEGKKGQLRTLTNVWAFNPGAHLNVYPNGHVRGSRGSRVVATIQPK